MVEAALAETVAGMAIHAEAEGEVEMDWASWAASEGLVKVGAQVGGE